MNRPRSYEILPIDRVIFGAGGLGSLNDQLDRLGGRWLLVTTPGVVEGTPLARRVVEMMGARRVGTYCHSSRHVPRSNVLEAAGAARGCGADGLLSLGGSSIADLAKAVAMCLADDIADAGALERMRVRFRYPDAARLPRMQGEPPPIVTLPTTLSAGEYTHGFGITHRGVKHIYLAARGHSQSDHSRSATDP